MKKAYLIATSFLAVFTAGCQQSEQKNFETRLIELHSKLVHWGVREYEQYVTDLNSFIQSNKGRSIQGWTCRQTLMEDICISQITNMQFRFKEVASSEKRYTDEVITFSGRVSGVETSMGIGIPHVHFEAVTVTAIKKRSN